LGKRAIRKKIYIRQFMGSHEFINAKSFSKAQQKLDRAVARAYGGNFASEEEMLEELVWLYLEMTQK